MRARGVMAACLTALALVALPGQARATARTDPFYQYAGTKPLSRIAPGTVLKSRAIDVHLEGLQLPVKAVQLLYRTTTALGKPSVTVTSVLEPVTKPATPKLISYQSFYDSLGPECEPSYALAGGFDHGAISMAETPVMVALLLGGYTVVTSDFEGEHQDFAAGPEYGMATLDGIRAALTSHTSGLTGRTPIGMLGYSGGAIATEWATELAPRYAPAVNRRLVGSAIGGVLVDPIHNLHYVSGSTAWSGVLPMAVIGISRAYHVDLSRYTSAYGNKLLAQLHNACILDALGHFPGLTFGRLVKPQYARPESIPVMVTVTRHLVMGRSGTPTVPMYVRQATGGEFEGTRGDQPGIGPGDGVMIAGDVRTLAREYCARGVTVDYGEYPGLSHLAGGAFFLPQAAAWLQGRFSHSATASTCGHIRPGNAL